MTFKTAHWAPELPLPRFADRKTLAAIITHHYFPVSHRTIQTWPLTVRRPIELRYMMWLKRWNSQSKSWPMQPATNREGIDNGQA